MAFNKRHVELETEIYESVQERKEKNSSSKIVIQFKFNV